ncbi:hypothetical protein GCM10023165_38720 [Variovorax defluvii]|uniref:Transposase IS66 C-terminal domain-containing protein n=1 Tax=Variovorax defluvii TaxID=913761 RepID=A0ABP8I463_9BURK
MLGMLGDTAASLIDIAQLPPAAGALISRLRQQVQTQAREIARAHAKLEKVNFELARLKRWKFGTKTEAMTAQQRALFQDTTAPWRWTTTWSSARSDRGSSARRTGCSRAANWPANAPVVMSLVQSAKLNGLDPRAYLRDMLARIHSHPSHRLDELLPHRWRPS